MTNETIISTMVERIVRRFQPACVVLFGSSEARAIYNSIATEFKRRGALSE